MYQCEKFLLLSTKQIIQNQSEKKTDPMIRHALFTFAVKKKVNKNCRKAK